MNKRFKEPSHRAKIKAYWKCVRILKMGCQGRRATAEEVAKRLGVPYTPVKKEQYELFLQFAGTQEEPPRKKRQWPPQTSSSPESFRSSDAFLMSYEWRRLRMFVITERGARCECCGATPQDGIRINVDHIKPRKLFPELALDKSNLQILCDVCNHGKGNWDETDWRKEKTDDTTRTPEPVTRSARVH